MDQEIRTTPFDVTFVEKDIERGVSFEHVPTRVCKAPQRHQIALADWRLFH